ncbi:recombination protein F [compost metagenome]
MVLKAKAGLRALLNDAAVHSWAKFRANGEEAQGAFRGEAMYLKRLTAKNFRSFDQIEIPLYEDLTVFAGENNGGKSNAIDAMRLLTLPLSGRREL